MGQEYLSGKPTPLQSGCDEIPVRQRVRQPHAAQSLIALATGARQVLAVPLPNLRSRPTVTTLNLFTGARKQSNAALSFLIWPHLAKTNRDCSRRG